MAILTEEEKIAIYDLERGRTSDDEDTAIIAILEEIEAHFDTKRAPAAPTTPGVVLIKHDADWYEYEAGSASIGIEEGKPSTMLGAGQMFEYLDRPERIEGFFNDLYTLLSDPAVQRYLNITPVPALAVEEEEDDGPRIWQAGYDLGVLEGMHRIEKIIKAEITKRKKAA